MHDRKDDVRDVGLEALGNKASQPRERCPRGQRRRCFARDSAGMDGLKRKTAREGTPEPKNDKSTANCRQTRNNHHSYRGHPDTDHPTRWQRHQAKQHRGADGSDSAQRSEAQQSQFIEETIEISAEADWIQKIVEIFLHYSAMMRRSSSGPQCSEDCGDVAG